jgi:hypothetical protein
MIVSADTVGEGPVQQVRVTRWGAPTRGGARAYRLPDAAVDQMRLAHQLGNDLVRLSLDTDEAVADVWSSYPQIADVEARITQAEERAAELAAEVARRKSAARSRRLTGADKQAADDLRKVRADIRELRGLRKEIKASVKLDAKSRLAEIDAAKRAAVKALRQDYSARGLYWGTSNDVIAHSAAADKRVADARKEGRPAQRRFRRWDGSGALTVQLQRQTGDPARTVDRLDSGRPVPGKSWASQLQVPASPGRGVVRFGLGSALPMVEVPVVAHRALPDGADVTGARLVVEAVAGQRHMSVHVASKSPAASAKTGGPVVALHMGWRRDHGAGGAVRVGSWRSDIDLTVPAHLDGIVTQDSPHSGRILLPAGVRAGLDRADEVRSDRDKELDRVKEWLAGWLAVNPQPVEEGRDPLTPARVKAWKSPGRFAALAHRWREVPPVGDRAAWVAGELESWRRWDRGRWEVEAHGRRKALAYRRDVYRRVAAWIAGTAGTVVVEDTDLAAIIRRPKTAEVLPGAVEDAAASTRVDAAPGELRAAVTAAAVRDGAGVVEVDHQGVTLTHHGCGHANPADGRWAVSAEVVCDGCGRRFDQDGNATVGMLARA